MQYHVFATDYDGTLAENSFVEERAVDALRKLRKTGRKLIIVTGRLLESLLDAFPEAGLCDLIVAENGALVYDPETKEEWTIGDPPPREFDEKLAERGVPIHDVGRVIRATHVPYEAVTLEVIRDLALEMQIIFNKGAVMVLPSGVNKAAGLKAALKHLGISPHNTVAVGDAENDEAMLRFAGVSAAVANALDPVKERADIVLKGAATAGVTELLNRIIDSDLQDIRWRDGAGFELGTTADDRPIWVPAYGERLFITGESAGGKSRLAVSILDQLIDAKYQVCVYDPDGDFQTIEKAIVLGTKEKLASPEEILQVMSRPPESCVISLFSAEAQQQPEAFSRYHRVLQEHRIGTGRPHFTILDEAHYPINPAWEPLKDLHLEDWRSVLYITAFPDRMPADVLESITLFIGVGQDLASVLRNYCDLIGVEMPNVQAPENDEYEYAVGWRRGVDEPFFFKPLLPRGDHQRHRHQYLEGEMDDDQCFYFRGSEGQLNLSAGNLKTFMHLARGVDDDTWQFHLQRGDYTRWFRDVIRDERLARSAQEMEKAENLSPKTSRTRIDEIIQKLYVVDN